MTLQWCRFVVVTYNLNKLFFDQNQDDSTDSKPTATVPPYANNVTICKYLSQFNRYTIANQCKYKLD